MRPPRNCSDDIPEVLQRLKGFLVQPESVSVNEPMRWKTAPINFADSSLELLPEVYLDSVETNNGKTSEEKMDRLARITASFLIREGREMYYVDDTT